MASRYEELTRFLREQRAQAVDLNFDALDRLVDGLPASARTYPAWWSNSRASQPQARYWLDAGRRATVDLNSGRVRFDLGAETMRTRRASVTSHGTSNSLTATGEVVEATVRFEWLSAGGVSLDTASRPTFPRLPALPGIYRFTLHDAAGSPTSVYIGEADNLARRMGHYRNPGPRQSTNVRMNARFVAVLGDGGAATVEVATEAIVDGEPLDLTAKSARLLAENAALLLAHRQAVPLDNL